MKIIIFLSTLLAATMTAAAQFGMHEKIVDVAVVASQNKIVSGEEFKLALVLDIKPTLHINSNKPLSEFFIPTTITFNPVQNLSFAPPLFPPPELKSFAFSDEKVSIYEGRVVILVAVSTSPFLALAPQTISGVVAYQGCDDNVCFPPDEQTFEILLDVAAAGTPVQQQYPDYFSRSNAESTGAEQVELTQDERTALRYLEKGLIGAILAFFVIGLALNLTPCVYPIIPITVSYFGGKSSTSKTRAFAHALFYLLGIALAFAALGLISGLAGKQWGFLFASPWFVVVIGTIILLMAAGLFGAFEISVPSWLLTKVSKSKEGAIGAFLMGLTAGIVIAPCAAGIIIGLVGLIAKLGLVVKGTMLFFVMGLGLGLPYLILATFSGLLGKLPQSGGWMLWVKKVFGFLLIAVALYFILPQLERIVGKFSFLIGIIGITSGFLLGFLEHGMYSVSFNRIRKVMGVLLIALGIYWVNGGIHAKKSEINWVQFENQTMDELLTQEKPVFIDFYADWCAPCKQLDRVTFTDKAVTELSRSFIMLKVDCTQPDVVTQAFMEQFKVTGLPTLVFISQSGEVLHDLREIRFVPPDKFAQSLQTALAAD